MTDREAYPAALITLLALAAAFLLWKYGLDAPAISGCWVLEHFGVYCPGCGGTRAVEALGRGEILRSLYFHPAVPVLSALFGVYLVSQTIWRLRGRKGWALRFNPRWPAMLVGLFLANCALRNLLLLGFGIPI